MNNKDYEQHLADFEISSGMDNGQQIEEVPKRLPSPLCGYDAFDRGNESGGLFNARPCSEIFLDQLLHDLSLWNVRLVYKLGSFKGLDTNVDDETKMIVKHIFSAMNEASRLRVHPELFVSQEQRKTFLSQISTISEQIMVRVDEITDTMEDMLHVNKSITNLQQPIRYRKVGGVYYKIRNPKSRDPEGLHYTETPKRNVWNKWLDNRLAPGFGIEQRIPDIGHRLLRRMEFMYNSIESSFEKTGRVLREAKNPASLAKSTGEDYSSLVVDEPIPHIDIALPVASDIYSTPHQDGAVKLEILNTTAAALTNRAFIPERYSMIGLVFRRDRF